MLEYPSNNLHYSENEFFSLAENASEFRYIAYRNRKDEYYV